MSKKNNLNTFLKQFSRSGNIEEAFATFARISDGNKKDFDLLITIQSEYRKSRKWDHDFHFVYEAGGYLGGKYKEIAEYIYQRIILKEKDNTESKYFLSYCLMIAAQYNVRASELLWNLFKYAENESDEFKNNSDYPYEYVHPVYDAQLGLKRSMELVDNATADTIIYYFDRIKKYGDPPSQIIWILNYILGDSPNVQCLVFLENKDKTKVIQNFSDYALPIIYNQRIHLKTEFIFRWCRNDFVFQEKALEVLDSTEASISFLISFLEMQLIAFVEYDIAHLPATESIMQVLNKDFNLEKETEGLEKKKRFLIDAIEQLKNNETKYEFHQEWIKIAKSLAGKQTLVTEAFDYIDYVRFKFRKQIETGYFYQ